MTIHQRETLQGRGDRTRTCDSLVPNQERYQLRYTSFFADGFSKPAAKLQTLIEN